MKLLEGKNALVFGLANKRSIAWGVTEALHKHGANVGISYAGEMLEKRARPLGESLGLGFIEPCDVTSDEQIEAVAKKAEAHFGKIDILVHAIAFANRDELTGPFYNTSREGFTMALEISAFSFVALAKAFQPLFNPGGSIMTMTYYGSDKVVPSYNVMGVAKAALESSMRYLATDFGPQGVRVNAISAGPIRTLASAGVASFKSLYKQFKEAAPLRQEITIEDVGGTAVYLASDLSAKTTGEVIFVDSGYNTIAAPEIPD
ncbi:MAG: enoyl-ACP reductase [Chloroflexota bacterium]